MGLVFLIQSQKSVAGLKIGSVVSWNLQVVLSYLSEAAIPVSPEYLFFKTLKVETSSGFCWSRSKATTVSLNWLMEADPLNIPIETFCPSSIALSPCALLK